MSRKLRLPRHMVFHHDLHLMVLRPRGAITAKSIEKDIEFLEGAEDRLDIPFNRFTDISQTDVSELHFKHVFRISLHRRLRYGKGPPVRSAFYATTPEAARIVRTHALLTSYSPLEVKMFEDLSAAADWLGVTTADLQIGS